MKAIYVNWSQPFLKREKLRGHGFSVFKNLEETSYYKPEYEILYTILSVSYWKKFNGAAKLYTDEIGKEYYEKMGLLSLWDEVDTETLEEFNKLEIDGGVFWTSAKSYCIAKEKGPFVFSDLDFIVRQRVPSFFYRSEISIPHWEIARGYYYPTEKELNSLSHWKPFEGFSPRMLVPNTSFLYVNNENLQDLYWKRHFDLVNTKEEVPEWAWLLSDQGLFGQSIRSLSLDVATLTDRVFLSENEGWEKQAEGWSDMWYFPSRADMEKEEVAWEHVWLAKVAYVLDPIFKSREIARYVEEIDAIFPECSHLIDYMR